MGSEAPICPRCGRADMVRDLAGRALGEAKFPREWFCDRCVGWLSNLAGTAAQSQPTVAAPKKKRAKASATTYICPRCQAQYPRPRGAGVCPVCQMQSNLTVALEPLEEPK